MQQRQSMEVVDHHLQALELGDLDSIMMDYADDAVMLFPDRTLNNKAEIHHFFETVLQEYGVAALAGVVPSKKVQVDDLIYVVWTQHEGSQQELRGVDNYLVKDGLIKIQAVFDA